MELLSGAKMWLMCTLQASNALKNCGLRNLTEVMNFLSV